MAQNILNRIRILGIKAICTLLLLLVCDSSVYATALKANIINPQNQKISLRLAITPKEQQKGLSGLRPHQFSYDEGMLFINNATSTHRFWMPDTYFNLDIIFLDYSLTIIGIEKDVPHHPGFKEPPLIYRTNEYNCQFILETKAQVPFSKQLKIGDKLKWEGTTSLSEIILNTHRLQ